MLNPATPAFLETLAARLPEDTLRPAEPRYLSDPRGRVSGQAAAVALPRSAEGVSEIVRACHEASVGVIPFGGGTGLVLGQVMAAGPAPLLVSLERMRAIRAIYPEENVLSGCFRCRSPARARHGSAAIFRPMRAG